MLKIAICDDNTVQLDIIQKELKKNINNEIPYSVDTFDNDNSFNNMLLSGTCPFTSHIWTDIGGYHFYGY